MPLKIVVGFDGSREAQKALRKAVQVSRDFKAQILAVWVDDSSDRKWKDSVHNSAAEMIRAEVDEVEKEGPVKIPLTIVAGTVFHDLLFFAEDNQADLIILGCRGLEGGSGSLGANVEKIVKQAHCDVWVVR